MKHVKWVWCGLLVVMTMGAAPATTQQGRDVVDLYGRAGDIAAQTGTESPANSVLDYRDYPPFGADWDRLEQLAWDKHAEARQLARQARSTQPVPGPEPLDMNFFGSCRALSNDLCDAALYQHFHGDDAGAVETVRDVLHLGSTLRQIAPPNDAMIPFEVSAGIEATAAVRTNMIVSDLQLTDKHTDQHMLPIESPRRLLTELLDVPSPDDQMHLLTLEAATLKVKEQDRLRETFCRVDAERILTAMSLACHLFKFDKGRWPTSVDELVPGYLTSVPIDYWGDGKQTFGYVLIKGGLPDGGDRPLVYSRCLSSDGLFYRADRPRYWWYLDDGSKRPSKDRKHGGQVHDVASWVPAPGAKAAATTRPLE